MGQRMARGHNVAEPVAGHVGVDLGGGDVGMAEQGLHPPQIRPAVQQMGGEGMPQDVGADLGRIKPRRQSRFAQQLVQPPRRQPPAPR